MAYSALLMMVAMVAVLAVVELQASLNRRERADIREYQTCGQLPRGER